ncbi:DegT/DnrJ/EryC1/StrS family aminotransferase [Caldicellulosiruptoraceae bacterium PP1]
MISLIDLKRQYLSIKDEINKAVIETLESGNYILGETVEKFEKDICNYLGVNYAIGVANGTDALVISLKALGIGPQDEVITTPWTFFATAEAIVQVGAKPVFVDVDKDTYNIDVNQIESKITKNTKAILPVHIFGQPADMDPINDLAKKYNLFVIEDACQAFGSEYKNRKIGTLGDIACFSFFPTKNLGGFGDGGIIVTNKQEIAEKVRLLRQHGMKKKYYNEIIGFNSRLDAIQAAMLDVKLKYIDNWNKARRRIANAYKQNISLDKIILPYEKNGLKHIYHLFVLQYENRELIMKYLNENNISTGVYYPVPLHLTKALEYLGYKKGDFPIAEMLSTKTFAIPMFPELNENEINYIISKINMFGGK